MQSTDHGAGSQGKLLAGYIISALVALMLIFYLRDARLRALLPLRG